MNRLYFNTIVKSLKEGEFEVIASNAKIDRFGDTINPDGWVLTNYKKNPVILWSHSTGGFGETAVPPVARATKVRVEEGALKVKGVFAPTPFAQELRTLVENGFLNAVSVGFIPLVESEKGTMEIEGKMYRRANEQEMKDFAEKGHLREGTKFEKQELLEVSWVNVPALPTALVTAKEMGLQLITKELETKMEIKPYANEHACRLESPDKYDKFRRANCAAKHDGKCIDFIYGILTPKKSELQSMRYDKKVWTVASARTHCKDKDGAFEAASEESLEDINTKEGRVLSGKNRKLIGEAISALKALLEATEPEKDIIPEVKNRKSSELRFMLLADKAVENALRKLKEDKLKRKTEIYYLQIASKVVDAAIVKIRKK